MLLIKETVYQGTLDPLPRALLRHNAEAKDKDEGSITADDRTFRGYGIV
jgi:hypothetical protein